MVYMIVVNLFEICYARIQLKFGGQRSDRAVVVRLGLL